MNEQPRATVALVGLPEAGKSTYVVAFFLACESGQDHMVITQYRNGNREYLNKLAQRLADCESLERTSQSEPGELRLRVKLGDNASHKELVIPDLSGELLREGMATRKLDERLASLVDAAQASMLFVRSDRVRAAVSLADFNEALRLAGQDVGGDTAPESPEDWEVRLAPTQVRLVDATQELIRRRGSGSRRVAVMLSAWDTQGDAIGPTDWATEHMPLLVQLLDGQPDVEWTVFGVSAQGGDFTNPADLQRLKATDLLHRPVVRRGDGQITGIGAPLRWALGESP